MIDIQRSVDFLYTGLGWLSNLALVVYVPFARSWQRALTVQFLIVVAWIIARMTADVRFGEHAGPASIYVMVIVETLLFAVVMRLLKLLLFKLPMLKRLEDRLRPTK